MNLGIVPVEGGSTTWVEWDRSGYEYLSVVKWTHHAPLTIVVGAGVHTAVFNDSGSTWVHGTSTVGEPDRWEIVGPGGPTGKQIHSVAESPGVVPMLDQWMADHGYVVVSIDGRGTPNRGRARRIPVHRKDGRPIESGQPATAFSFP